MKSDKINKTILNMDALELDGDLWIYHDIPFTGIIRGYTNSGSLEVEIELTEGLPNGKWTEYHLPGRKKLERNYKNGMIDGQVTYWNKKDKVTTIEVYELGIKLEKTTWDENGRITNHVNNLKDNPQTGRILKLLRDHFRKK